MIKKIIANSLKRTNFLTSISMMLVKLTGKHKDAIHPKHLINLGSPWYLEHLKKTDVVLDLGCGVGQESIKCAPLVKSVIGFDVNVKNIGIAKNMAKDKKLTNIKFLVSSAEKIFPFRSNYFDKILMFDVIEHLKNREKALKEAKRVLKKGGMIFLVTDNPQTSWKRFQKSQGLSYYADRNHKYEYPRKEIVSLLEKNMFKVLSIKPVTFDTPLKPFIDLIGGFSLSLYTKLSSWRRQMVLKYPSQTTGFQIVALNTNK